MTGGRGVVTAGAGAAGFVDGACDGEADPPAAVVRTVVVVDGRLTVGSNMIKTMPTTAVMMPRRRTDQSFRNQSRITPTGKKKIRKSTTATLRRYQGSVGCTDGINRVRDDAPCGEMTNSSSATHSGQPYGGSGQDGSGFQPRGGVQPAGT